MRRLSLTLGLILLSGCEDLPPEAVPPVVAIAPSPSPVLTPSPTPTPSPSATPPSRGRLDLAGNLDARVPTDAPETPEGPLNYIDLPGTIYDALDQPHCAVLRFIHESANRWTWQLYVPDAASLLPDLERPPRPLDFDAVTAMPLGGVELTWSTPTGGTTHASITFSGEALSHQAAPTTLRWLAPEGPCE